MLNWLPCGSWGVIGIHFGVITRPKMRESREGGGEEGRGGRLADRGEGNKERRGILPQGSSVVEYLTRFIRQNRAGNGRILNR